MDGVRALDGEGVAGVARGVEANRLTVEVGVWVTLLAASEAPGALQGVLTGCHSSSLDPPSRSTCSLPRLAQVGSEARKGVSGARVLRLETGDSSKTWMPTRAAESRAPFLSRQTGVRLTFCPRFSLGDSVLPSLVAETRDIGLSRPTGH